MRVLVVDDEQFTRELTTAYLKTHGYTVLEADSGESLLKMLTLEHFDAVVTDDQMPPGMSGIDALRQIKGDPRYTHIRRIVVSGTAKADDAEAVGARFLMKPASKNAILALLARET